MKMIGFVTVLSVGLAVGGCARTKMSSIVAPDAADKSYRTILVVGGFEDLGIRQQAEQRFVAGYSRGQTRFIASSGLLFPGRQYSDAEIATVLKDNEIDATLVLTPGVTGVNQQVQQPTYTSTCTPVVVGGPCQQVTTKASGGATFAKPWAQFTAQLFDASTGKVVWYATARTGGNAFASATTLVRSMADKTIGQLTAARLIE